MKLFITFTSLLLFSSIIKAQQVAPLKIGNIWIYDNLRGISRITVNDTVAIDSTYYYRLYYESPSHGLQYYTYARLKKDSFYVRLYEADSTEYIYYKKNASLGDFWIIDSTATYTVEDTFVTSVFGEATTVKFLVRENGLVYIEELWTEKFGKLSSGSPFSGMIDAMKGCVIDGIVYGDTAFNIVSIEDDFEIPGSIYLSQNYPNPFNSNTIIEYFLPNKSFVNLTVYNIIGEQIAVIVDEFQKSGKYKVQISANDLKNPATGIYIYSLKTDKKQESKKMIILN